MILSFFAYHFTVSILIIELISLSWEEVPFMVDIEVAFRVDNEVIDCKLAIAFKVGIG